MQLSGISDYPVYTVSITGEDHLELIRQNQFARDSAIAAVFALTHEPPESTEDLLPLVAYIREYLFLSHDVVIEKNRDGTVFFITNTYFDEIKNIRQFSRTTKTFTAVPKAPS